MSLQQNGASHPLRVFVFDNMRARSHIFSQMFSQHPQFRLLYHPFLLPSFLGPERTLGNLKHSEQKRKEVDEDFLPMYVQDTYGASQLKLERDVAEVEKAGLNVWINEHSAIAMRQDLVLAAIRGHDYSMDDLGVNPTYAPNWLLQSCTPIIVIRHPALMMPSLQAITAGSMIMHPEDEDYEFCTSLYFCRLIFDWFKAQGRTPIVVDGEDVVLRRKEMTSNVCRALGIDPEGLKEEWEPTPADQRPTNPIIAAFTKTIHESTGVVTSAQSPDVDIDRTIKKMKEKYGEDLANGTKRLMIKNMPHYDYLKQFAV